MKRWMVLALTVVSVLCLAPLGEAREPLRNLVPFTATWEPLFPRVREISVSPPVSSVEETARGEADLLGPFQWVGHHIAHAAVYNPGRGILTEGIGVMTAANGDALLFRYQGRFDPPDPTKQDSGETREFVFVITGGRGRFWGATGSGRFSDGTSPFWHGFARHLTGTISVPNGQ